MTSHLDLLPALSVTLGIGLVVALALVATRRWHGKLSFDYSEGVQKVHSTPVPRIGGVAVMVAIALSTTWLSAELTAEGLGEMRRMLLLASVPALIAGLGEDLTKRVGVGLRLFATMASGVLFAMLSGRWLTDVGVPGLDLLLPYPVVGIAFTAFAVGGVANAINILDGFNGLAAGVAIIVLVAIASIANQVGDAAIVQFALLSAAAIGGFALVNFPRGALFMGDGGAYFIGFLLAQLAVLLVERNPQVSPWALFAVFAYPLVETLFSIARRLRNHRHPSQPDRVHLHSLIHGRVTRHVVPRVWPPYARNAATAPMAWAIAAVPAALTSLYWNDSGAALMVVGGFALLYNALYARLVRFRWCLRSTLGLYLLSPTARSVGRASVRPLRSE